MTMQVKECWLNNNCEQKEMLTVWKEGRKSETRGKEIEKPNSINIVSVQ